MTINSASSISIGPQRIVKKKEDKQVGRYNKLTIGVNVNGSSIMEKDSSREAFGFATDVISSTRWCTNVNNFIVIVLKFIMTPLFVSLDMFVV